MKQPKQKVQIANSREQKTKTETFYDISKFKKKKKTMERIFD